MAVAENLEGSRHPAVIVAAVAVALIMPAAVFAPLGEAAIGGVIALALLIRLLARESIVEIACRLAADPIARLFAAMLAWAAITALWSPGGAKSLVPTGQILATTVAGSISVLAARSLNTVERKLILSALVAGFILGGGLLAFELAFKLPLSRAWRHVDNPDFYTEAHLKRGLTVLTILVWPVASHLRAIGHRQAAAAAILAAGAIILLSTSRASILALILALLIGGIALIRFRAFAAWALSLTIGAMILAPVAAGEIWHMLDARGMIGFRLESLELGRLGIWDYATDLFLRRPFLGWGMDASRYIGPDTIYPSPYRFIPLHPHDAPLQIALELGLPGLLLALTGLVIVMHRTLARANAWQRASAIAMLVSVFLVFSVGYGVWQAWWQATVWLAAAFLALSWRGADPATARS